jgi:methylated-DNA-[protein]-cysteine S-methyltransferase
MSDLFPMPGTHHYTVFDTAHGVAGIVWCGNAVTQFRLPGDSREATERSLLKRLPDALPGDPPPVIAEVIDMVVRYFAGEHVDFSNVSVDLGAQEPFFARTYDAVRALGWGETTTYGAVARSIGAPLEAARAVGQAMGRNPVPLIVPCHRVLAAGGRLHGFSAPGGALSKARMLQLEGVATEPPPAAQVAFDF